MARTKRVPRRDDEIPVSELLGEAGLTDDQWQAYLQILRSPFADHDVARPTLDLLVAQGLLRVSLEREFGYAPIPPGTAFTKLMERYDEELLRSMRAGMQLRRMLRGVSQVAEAVGGASENGGTGPDVRLGRAVPRSTGGSLRDVDPGRRHSPPRSQGELGPGQRIIR